MRFSRPFLVGCALSSAGCGAEKDLPPPPGSGDAPSDTSADAEPDTDAASGADTADTDADQDGYTAQGGDCDDGNAAVSPGSPEICDEVDNDCDGLTDDEDDGVTGASTWYTDNDGDGYGKAATSACAQPAGASATGGDCDDGSDAIHPGAAELCYTAWDDDCDGVSAAGCDDGTVCSGMIGADDGRVPTWEGACDPAQGFEPYGDHCYYAVTTVTLFWEDARASCMAAGGYLATIADSAEATFVQSIANRPFLGGCDGDVEGQWTWITGEPWDYSAWAPGEPNDTNGGEDCMESYDAGGGTAKWNDAICTEDPYNGGYVCEFEGITAGK